MDRKLCISLVILALVLLAGPSAKAATLSGGTNSIDAARQLMPPPTSTSSMRLEDGVAPELAVVSTAVDLGVHRRVLVGYDAGPLNGNKQACRPKCAQPGGPNTGRGCLKIYGCRGGH